ncbi:MAG: DNA translocase FtsK 4TM domain-containing protein [Anaerolineae bacterium]|jgi:S-DNA-T family DNA segregation ATPase FtsK/SpoIIIE
MAKRSRLRKALIRISRDTQLDILGYFLLALSALTLLALLSTQRGALLGPWVRLLSRIFGWGVYIVPFFVGAVGLYLVLRRFGDRIPRPLPTQVVGTLLLFTAMLTTIHYPVVWLSRLDSHQAAEAGYGGGYLGAGIGKLLERGLGRAGAGLALTAVWLLGLFFAFGVSPASIARGVLALWRRLRPLSLLPHRPSVNAKAPQPEARDRRPTDEQERPTPSKRSPRAARPTPSVERAPQTAGEQPIHPRLIGEQTWQLPRVDAILEPGDQQHLDQEIARQQAHTIEETLASLGAPVAVKEINQGPIITQFGVEPLVIPNRRGEQRRVKVSKISSRADDLALALSAKTIRIQAPIPGKNLLGIEVPNREVALVALRDIIESEAWEEINSHLRLGLGQNVSGQAYTADLTTMPHLLIAGATGSGKSVCINAVLAALLLQNTPDNLKLLLVDPKRVELTLYNGIPHLLAPVVVEMERVVGALKWVLREMDGRYKRFADAGARDIVDYNERVVPQMPDAQKMPYIVVVVDELADLMMLSPHETERAICRLAQMARATGIHLIIATQRPSVDVVTGLIKANFPARIAFAVASSVDSRVILDTPGAERLLGQGDMLFMPADAADPIRLQGSFVSGEELRRLVRYWKGGRELRPETAPAAESATVKPVQLTLQGEVEEKKPKIEFEDDLLPDALEVLLAEDRASISLMQRRLRIGYTRSARIMDLLVAKDIVGPPKSAGQAREIDRAAAEALLRKAAGE